MAYTTTAREYIENILPDRLKTASGSFTGILDLEIYGQNGGHWFIDLASGRNVAAAKSTKLIMRATDIDFMALIEARMSLADGLLTGRLKITGEILELTKLFESLVETKR